VSQAPFSAPLDLLPVHIRGIVERDTPIPSIALTAQTLSQKYPQLVRADIGQISGFDADLEVLYGPPVGLPALREMIAESWNLSHGFTAENGLSTQGVAVCTGAAEGLSLLLKCFAEGKKVGLPRGHWENYLNGVALAKGETVILDYFDQEGALDTDNLKKTIKDAGVEVIVANFPCNPTGAVLNTEEAQRLANMIKELNIICIADEVYDRLRYDGHEPVSLMPFAPEHIVSVSSASKEYLLPGARVGFVLAFASTITDQILRKVIRASSASPNVLGQRRLLELLGPDLEDMRAGREPGLLSRIRKELQERKENLVRVLEVFEFSSIGRPNHLPQGTIFLMAGLPSWWQGNDTDFAQAALDACCVSTVPGSAFGLPGSVRFSYGGMTVERIEQLEKNLQKFRDSLAVG
jgi:aspartate/methionine/tyrosine aminotransferase